MKKNLNVLVTLDDFLRSSPLIQDKPNAHVDVPFRLLGFLKSGKMIFDSTTRGEKWYTRKAITSDSTAFLTNLLVSLCNQQQDSEAWEGPPKLFTFSMWGLTILVAHGAELGLAYMHDKEPSLVNRLCLEALFRGMVQNEVVQELIGEGYERDTNQKTLEIKTFTINDVMAPVKKGED